MEKEYIKEEEIIENYRLSGIYEEIQIFAEITQNLDEKIHNQSVQDTIKKYFCSK